MERTPEDPAQPGSDAVAGAPPAQAGREGAEAAAAQAGDSQPSGSVTASADDDLSIDPLEAAAAAAATAQEEAGPSEHKQAFEVIPPATADDEALLKEFFLEVKQVDKDNEVNRILGCFKLNPFEQLNLPFDATVEDVKRAYRKASLLVHPDKCEHPRAKDAFEVLGHAAKELSDESRLKELRHLLNLARDEVRKEYRKSTKHDAAIRLAAVLHEAGRAGVDAEYEKTPQFHEAWKLKSRDVLARYEWRRRKLNKRVQEETLRIEEGEEETRKRLKALREHTAKWESGRDQRVGTWRDFVKKKSDKGSKGAKPLGGIKPPKLKVEDEEHTYIQRPVGEQFRPPPPAVPKPNRMKQ